MCSKPVYVLIFAFVAVIFAQDPPESKNDEGDGRIFLSTFTVILSTVTSTATIATTTTCTTSSTAMSACSAPAGRRRRGILYDEEEKQGRGRRGLFYNDEEAEEKDSTSLSSGHSKRSVVAKETPPSVTIDNTNLIPLNIQSGFSLPDGFPVGTARFKLAYGTSTVTTTSISTSTKSLTIFCSSITNYPTCSGSG